MEEETNEHTNGNRRQSSTGYKIFRTIWLITTWIALGAFMEVAGTTLKDFVYRLKSDYGSVSSAYAGRSIGKFVGAVLGGILVDKVGRFADLMIAVCLTSAAVATFSLPWTQHLEVLWFLYAVLGMCLGTIDIAGQRILLCTWLENSASPMHIMHLGYGAGGFLVPLIVNPFLADFSAVQIKETLNMTNDQNSTIANISLSTTLNTSLHEMLSNSTVSPDLAPVSRIEYGYSIIAAYTMCIAVVFYIYQYYVSHDLTNTSEPDSNPSNKLFKKRSFREMVNPASCADGNLCFGSLIIGLLFLRCVWIVAVDRETGTFLRSYVVDQLYFSKDDASYLNMVYWICYSAGRLIMFVIAHWVSIRIIMVIESVGSLVTGIFLLIFALHNPTAMWVLTVFMGIFLGPMYPSGMAWGNFHIDMTGMVILCLTLASAIGGFVFIKLTGDLYDLYGPSIFVYVYLFVGVFVLATDLALTFVSVMKSRIIKKSEEFSKEEQEEITAIESAN